MAVTQADLDALDRAILGAELEVEYQGRRVRFRSIAELKVAYQHAQQVMASQAPAARGATFGFTFVTQRGD